MILIVEDDDGIRDVLCDIMRIERLPFHAVKNGQEAIVAAKTIIPRVVVLDANLPMVGGIAVAHEIHRIHGDAVPILMITADGRGQEKAIEACATAWLKKPFSLPAFLDKLYEMIQLSQLPPIPGIEPCER